MTNIYTRGGSTGKSVESDSSDVTSFFASTTVAPNKLRHWRRSLGMSQRDAATLVGISWQSLEARFQRLSAEYASHVSIPVLPIRCGDWRV